MTTGIGSSYLDNLRWPDQKPETEAKDPNQQLTQEDFFALLTQQLSYQDPSKPMDNDQMISQMASFSQIEGINQMTEQMGSLAASMQSSQALQASTLVGKNVLVPTDTAYLSEGGDVSGTVIAGGGSGPITLRVEDESGQLIKTVALEGQEGNVRYTWDGTDANGDPMPQGNYVIKAESQVNGQNTTLPVAVNAGVESVTLNTGDMGVVVNLKGMGSVMLTDLLEVAES